MNCAWSCLKAWGRKCIPWISKAYFTHFRLNVKILNSKDSLMREAEQTKHQPKRVNIFFMLQADPLFKGKRQSKASIVCFLLLVETVLHSMYWIIVLSNIWAHIWAGYCRDFIHTLSHWTNMLFLQYSPLH